MLSRLDELVAHQAQQDALQHVGPGEAHLETAGE
jgi:hypothetical protein